MSPDLFKADALDELVLGYTNAPLALHDGTISEETLSQIHEVLKQHEPLSRRFNSGITSTGEGIMISTGSYNPLLRIDGEEGVVDYVAVKSSLNLFPHIKHYQFSLDGNLIKEEEGQMSFKMVGVYLIDTLTGRDPSSRTTVKKYDEMNDLFNQVLNANKVDAHRVASGVQVYLDPVNEGAQLNGMNVERVPLSTPEQYVSGSTEMAVQIRAYLLGANAVINYQRASPSRATPVILK